MSFSFHWLFPFPGLGSRSLDVGLWNWHGPGNAHRCGTCNCRKYLRLYDMGHYYAGLHRNDGCGESSSAVFKFPNLCNAKNEQFTGGTLRSAIVKALGPGEQFTPDHDGVLKQIFCIWIVGWIPLLAVVIVCSIFIWPELAVAVHGPQHPKATNDPTAE